MGVSACPCSAASSSTRSPRRCSWSPRICSSIPARVLRRSSTTLAGVASRISPIADSGRPAPSSHRIRPTRATCSRVWARQASRVSGTSSRPTERWWRTALTVVPVSSASRRIRMSTVPHATSRRTQAVRRHEPSRYVRRPRHVRRLRSSGRTGSCRGVRRRGARSSRVSGRSGWSLRSGPVHESEWAAMSRVAGPLGAGTPEAVRKGCRRAGG